MDVVDVRQFSEVTLRRPAWRFGGGSAFPQVFSARRALTQWSPRKGREL